MEQRDFAREALEYVCLIQVITGGRGKGKGQGQDQDQGQCKD